MAQIDELIAKKRQTANSDDVDGTVNNNGTGDENIEGSLIEKEKVISLYSSDEAKINVFMIHGSHKSALSLASFAMGFQDQVKFSKQAQ